jgi:hypothetical protein
MRGHFHAAGLFVLYGESIMKYYRGTNPGVHENDVTPIFARPTGLFAALEPSPLRPAEGFELFFLNGTALMFAAAPGLGRPSATAVRVFDLATQVASGWACKPKTLGRSGDGKRYVLLAFCDYPRNGKCGSPPAIPGEGVHAFVSTDVRTPDSFKPRDPADGMRGSLRRGRHCRHRSYCTPVCFVTCI